MPAVSHALAAELYLTIPGNESFYAEHGPHGFTLLDFWRWSSSDLLNNVLRGVLAEFLVGQALGIVEKPRVEWDFYDLATARGVKVEVKSSAYLQSWDQQAFSVVEFDIEPKPPNSTRPELGTDRRRQADVQVFARHCQLKSGRVGCWCSVA